MLKTFSIIVFLISSLTFSIQNIHAKTIPQDEKFNVIFSISNSEAICKSVAKADSVKNLSYFIYDEKGNRIKSSQQITTNNNSAEIKEYLPKGKYRFVFLSSEKPLNFHVAESNSDIPSFIYVGLFDIYHKAEEVIVGKHTLRKNILLNKLSSSLEFDLSNENIPENVSSVEIHWTDSKYVDFNGNSFTFARKTKRITLNPDDKNLKKVQLSAIVFNTSEPFNVSIKYFNNNQQYIAGTEISDVRCYADQKTLISGTFLNTAPTSLKANVSLPGHKSRRSVL